MKFIILTLLMILTVSSINSFNLKNKAANDQQYPEKFQTNQAVKDKALKQTKAARALLNRPTGEALVQIKAAAFFFKWFMDAATTKTLFESADWNRQQKTGMFGPTDFFTKDNLAAAVGRVEAGTGSGKDIAGLLALLGDMGTALTDFPDEDAKAVDKRGTNYANLKIVFEKFTQRSTFGLMRNAATLMKTLATGIKTERGGNALAPGKKAQQERGFIKSGTNPLTGATVTTAIPDEFKVDPRSGVFSTGAAADAALGITAANAVPNISWPWQTLKESVIDGCTSEPWAGHYSGSIVEVLLALDLLTYDQTHGIHNANPILSFTNVDPAVLTALPKGTIVLNDAKRRARAALAGAFLVAIGFHSANEVMPTMKRYLGLELGATPGACNPNATDEFSTLMAEFTGKRRKRKMK